MERDPLDDLDTAEAGDAPDMMQANVNWARSNGAEYVVPPRSQPESVIGVTHAACRKCNGTGRYLGNSQYGSKCFACGGTGKGLSLNPSAVKSRERLRNKKAAKAQSVVDRAAAYLVANPDIAKWFEQNPRYDFAISLRGNLNRYGDLSVGQAAAIRRNIDALAQRKVADKAREVNVAGEGFTKLIACFEAAKASGLKNPAMTFERVCFKYAKKYPGTLYVTSDKSFGSTFYGKIDSNGKFDPRQSTPPSIIEEVKRIGADPFGEAVAHGHRTGSCCCCGRELTNQESVDLGIGPICRKRWGM